MNRHMTKWAVWAAVLAGTACAPKNVTFNMPSVPSNIVPPVSVPDLPEYQVVVSNPPYDTTVNLYKAPKAAPALPTDRLALALYGNPALVEAIDELLRRDLVRSGIVRLVSAGDLGRLGVSRTETVNGVQWVTSSNWLDMLQVAPVGGIDLVLEMSDIQMKEEIVMLDSNVVVSPAAMQAYTTAYEDALATNKASADALRVALESYKSAFQGASADYTQRKGRWSEYGEVPTEGDAAKAAFSAIVTRTEADIRRYLQPILKPGEVQAELARRQAKQPSTVVTVTATVSLRDTAHQSERWFGKIKVQAGTRLDAVKQVVAHVLDNLR